jgi:hypothetical protein
MIREFTGFVGLPPAAYVAEATVTFVQSGWWTTA